MHITHAASNLNAMLICRGQIWEWHHLTLNFIFETTQKLIWCHARKWNLIQLLVFCNRSAVCSSAGWEPGPLSGCVSAGVVTAAQTADRGTVVCCFAEMMMPPSIQYRRELAAKRQTRAWSHCSGFLTVAERRQSASLSASWLDRDTREGPSFYLQHQNNDSSKVAVTENLFFFF